MRVLVDAALSPKLVYELGQPDQLETACDYLIEDQVCLST